MVTSNLKFYWSEEDLEFLKRIYSYTLKECWSNLSKLFEQTGEFAPSIQTCRDYIKEKSEQLLDAKETLRHAETLGLRTEYDNSQYYQWSEVFGGIESRFEKELSSLLKYL